MSRSRAAFGLRRPETAPAGPDAPAPPPASATFSHLYRRVGDLSALHLLRQAVFLAILLAAWISLKPFGDLSRPDVVDLVTGQEALTYASFGLLALCAVALVLREHRHALAALVTRSTIAFAAWLCLSVVISQDPGTSVKRLGLTAAIVAATACLPLLPRSRAEMGRLLAVAALMLLGLCYAGMIVVPDLTIHQRNDVLEPALAGNWRGTFGHKNAAAAVMAMIVIIGVGVFRAGSRLPGAAITLLACTFLVGAEGKSAFALVFVVFALSLVFVRVTSSAGRAALVLGPILLLNVFSVGTVMSDGLAAILAMLPIDTTFTGRTDIWRFAIEAIAARPIAGHGFAAFWGNQAVRDLAEDGDSWAGLASHSHNGFLDTALTLGLVGLALLVLVFVIAPLRDYQRLSRDEAAGPFAMMFLQIWLFGLLLSSMESFFFDRADPIWVTFLLAVFGLRYMARFQTR